MTISTGVSGYWIIEGFENAVVELLDWAGHKPTEEVDSWTPIGEIFDTYRCIFMVFHLKFVLVIPDLKFGNNQIMKRGEPNMVSILVLTWKI